MTTTTTTTAPVETSLSYLLDTARAALEDWRRVGGRLHVLVSRLEAECAELADVLNPAAREGVR